MSVSLSDLLMKAGANNLVLDEWEKKYEVALAKQIKEKEWYLPTFYAGVKGHQLFGSAMNGDGRFFTNVNRNNYWVGAGANAEWDFGKGKTAYNAAGKRAEGIRFQSQGEKNQILLKLVHAYLDLQAAQLEYETLEILYRQTDTIIRQIELQVEAGLRYKSELLLAKSNAKHTEFMMKRSRVTMGEASATLGELLNMKEAYLLVCSEKAFIPVELVDKELVLKRSFEPIAKRPELLGMRMNIEALQEERLQYTKGLKLPRLNVGLYDGVFGDPFSSGFNTFEVNVGLIWDLPLGSLLNAYKGDVKRVDSEIAWMHNQIEQFSNTARHDVIGASTRIELAVEQIEVAKEGLELAGTAWYQSRERQKLGTVKPFEVFQAQEYYIQAQLDYIEAVKAYNKAQYDLFVAQGNQL